MSKKLRNRFIALVCLLAFAGVGVLFYANWVVQKPFAIVLFLTDNLTTSTLRRRGSIRTARSPG
jgi:hypothetical protein